MLAVMTVTAPFDLPVRGLGCGMAPACRWMPRQDTACSVIPPYTCWSGLDQNLNRTRQVPSSISASRCGGAGALPAPASPAEAGWRRRHSQQLVAHGNCNSTVLRDCSPLQSCSSRCWWLQPFLRGSWGDGVISCYGMERSGVMGPSYSSICCPSPCAASSSGNNKPGFFCLALLCHLSCLQNIPTLSVCPWVGSVQWHLCYREALSKTLDSAVQGFILIQAPDPS